MKTSGKIGMAVALVINIAAMIFLTFHLMSLPWLAGDEKFLIWSTSAIKVATREVPDPSDFAFINTSYDLQLIDRYDDFGFPVGNQVITDRQKLATLFKIINQAEVQPEYILCDIHFLDATASDEALEKELRKTQNLLISAHLNDSEELEEPIFEGIPYGISDYVIGNVFDGVYKYQLIYHDTLKLTPLVMHEYIAGVSAAKAGYGVDVGDFRMPNNFIINYRLLQKDIEDQEAGFNPINLGELLFLPDESIHDFIGGKIVVIGDFFEQDIHETLYEETAGPIILLNAFLSIQNQDVYLNAWFFVLLALCYGYLSYMAFYRGDYLENQIKKRFKKFKGLRMIAGFMNYLILLSVLSVVTFFIFGIHLNVFFLACAFYGLDTVTQWFYRLKDSWLPS